MHYNSPLGHHAVITDEQSIWFGQKGRVIIRDGNVYHIEIVAATGENKPCPRFDRDQFALTD